MIICCRRKRGERGERVETSVETPGAQIVRKLTIDRVEELKQMVQEEQQKYKFVPHYHLEIPIKYINIDVE